ncbi:hypothetical protein WOLCODRAFT_90362 [Wolfiporia cocos MD-104 SS10]|uniref:Protein kinase domain-containing protein n=1 Tax=Wolfiporia cocos (strain MD-104) TaxID=742152 RepID=A0A2H3K3F2_WOLCO|nr:hypothetical protein WOLCODRAFT_90362 [Wolfiporia cocos MD-104 SS10]
MLSSSERGGICRILAPLFTWCAARSPTNVQRLLGDCKRIRDADAWRRVHETLLVRYAAVTHAELSDKLRGSVSAGPVSLTAPAPVTAAGTRKRKRGGSCEAGLGPGSRGAAGADSAAAAEAVDARVARVRRIGTAYFPGARVWQAVFAQEAAAAEALGMCSRGPDLAAHARALREAYERWRGYPVQLPPLSLTSSKRTQVARRESSDDYQNGSLTQKRAVLVNEKPVSARPSHHVLPIHISTSSVFSSASSPSSTPPATPFLASKHVPRSPLVSSPRQLTSPVSRSAQPFKSSLSQSYDDRSSRDSSNSSATMDILSQGDLVGEGLLLQGETIVRVPISSSEPRVDYDEPAKEFEVVRRLGTGSYAVVYLVREVLSRSTSPSSDDVHGAAVAGRLDMDDSYFARPATRYGREYAIKLLSKANLDQDALEAQLFEATIHQSLPAHPNIVTLHRTLETPSFLLLLLEFVPGEDLFYFLEQARDHFDAEPELDADATGTSRTPSSPGLLASLAPSQLLSHTRLRLIASMFAQMCDAVATCHEHFVFHRDIKPENFIVTDGWATGPDGRRERKVVVKLTDFGLSTTDTDSADMDCGSAPYMSFECRNNLHPTYSPRAADVWSLGIVLINMLYHYNPWTDAAQGVCSSFEVYRQQPVAFFMGRFTGMTLPVAEFLAHNVFCILDGPKDDAKRISARGFGTWVRDLPTLLGAPVHGGHSRSVSISSVQGHRLASIPHSRRPSLRSATPIDAASQRASRSLSRAPSFGPAYEFPAETSVLSTVPDQENEEQEQEQEEGREHGHERETSSRSTSTTKRRKRGARKGKNALLAAAKDETLVTLAEASQTLARELSRTSRTSQSVGAGVDVPLVHALAPVPAPATPLSSAPSISKKSSKWKLSFGKTSAGGKAAAAEEAPAHAEPAGAQGKVMSSTASNVTSLLMSLNAPPAPDMHAHAHAARPQMDEMGAFSHAARRPPKNYPYGAAANGGTWGPSTGSAFLAAQHSNLSNGSLGRRGPAAMDQRPPRGASPESKRGVSPTSTRSGRPAASSASSTASSNWRSSMSSASTSTSAFTRYSNGSVRSVSTAATSLSSGSWRSTQTGGSKPAHESGRAGALPANVKYVTGTPWELSEMPRQLHNDPHFKYSSPPARARRATKSKDPMLDTISERPHQKPVAQRMDAATSTTDLSRADRDAGGDGDHDGNPRKVQKGQINALAKMLSALRR